MSPSVLVSGTAVLSFERAAMLAGEHAIVERDELAGAWRCKCGRLIYTAGAVLTHTQRPAEVARMFSTVVGFASRAAEKSAAFRAHGQ